MQTAKAPRTDGAKIPCVLFLLTILFTAAQCPTLQVPLNAIVVGTCGSETLASCTFDCETGFKASGDQTRTCDATGRCQRSFVCVSSRCLILPCFQAPGRECRWCARKLTDAKSTTATQPSPSVLISTRLLRATSASACPTSTATTAKIENQKLKNQKGELETQCTYSFPFLFFSFCLSFPPFSGQLARRWRLLHRTARWTFLPGSMFASSSAAQLGRCVGVFFAPRLCCGLLFLI